MDPPHNQAVRSGSNSSRSSGRMGGVPLPSRRRSVMSLEVLWEPRADVLETSRVGDFIRRFGLGFTTYDELWQWSVDDLPGFWRAVWDYFDVMSDTSPDAVLSTRVMPGAHWFVGTRLNYAEHVLRMPGIADDEPAVLAYSQTRAPVTLTAAELRDEVRRVRAGLRRLGVAP